MNKYDFSVTNEMLKTCGNFGSFDNHGLIYAINQATTEYPEHIVKTIEYSFKNDTHIWSIYLVTKDEIII